MSLLTPEQREGVDKARYRTLIRRVVDDLMDDANLDQLKHMLNEVECMELYTPPKTEPPKPLKPRFKIIRRRRGIVYDAAYRTSLKGAEKLAHSYFNGDDMQPHEVWIQGTNDPAGRRLFGCGSVQPRWRMVKQLMLWVVKLSKGRAKGPTLEIAATEESTARARAEAVMGIGYRVTSMKRAS